MIEHLFENVKLSKALPLKKIVFLPKTADNNIDTLTF